MKNQLQTLRDAVNLLHPDVEQYKKAVDALAQLEAMAGEQEPLAWQSIELMAAQRYRVVPSHESMFYRHAVVAGDGTQQLYIGREVECENMARKFAGAFLDGAYVAQNYAAPVAQQYEAGDVASAAAQGFRDGVASVAQQEPVAWAMPKGDGTFIDVITPAEHARKEGSYTVPLFAHPLAQHPQTEPDDETLKERDDAEDFIDMLLDEVLGTDRPEWTSAYGRDDALRDVQERMTALHKPTVDKAWDRFEKAQQPQADTCQMCGDKPHPGCNSEFQGDKACRFWPAPDSSYRDDNYWRGWNAAIRSQQPQAEPDIHEARGQIEFLDKKNNALLTAIHKVMARLADLLDEDQFKEIEETISSAGVQPQAEAVPSDVVRDADLALDLLSKLFNAYENGLACYEDPDEQAGYVGNAVELDADTIHACADLLNRRRPIAAIAQQKGQRP